MVWARQINVPAFSYNDERVLCSVGAFIFSQIDISVLEEIKIKGQSPLPFQLFTEDQLVLLMDFLVSPNYYV